MTNGVKKQSTHAFFDESAANNGGRGMGGNLAYFENADERLKELALGVEEICKQTAGLGQNPKLDFAATTKADSSGPERHIVKLHIPLTTEVPLAGEMNSDFEGGARSVTGRVTVMHNKSEKRLAAVVWDNEGRLVIAETTTGSPLRLTRMMRLRLAKSNLLRPVR